jgi:2-oxoglutarate dehydrogenase E1 component
MKIPEGLNLNFLDAQYQSYKQDPKSVSREWRVFFYGFEIADQRGGMDADDPHGPQSVQVAELIQRYRDLGHLLACLDPLSACPTTHPLLELDAFGLSSEDLSKRFSTPQFSFASECTLQEIIQILKQTYCRSTGVEYMHLQDPDERRWLQDQMEPVRNSPQPEAALQRRILGKLIQAAALEQFLNKKYQAVTRFSLEGGDALIPMLDVLFEHLAQFGAQEVIVGMAHRGRLNVQANLLQKPAEEIFAEFETCYDAEHLIGDGDVKYHNGYLADIDLPDSGALRAFLVNNPSHLEAVNPVVEGVVRARQELCDDRDRRRVVPLLLHGDAAFAGQGIVAETLNMSQLAGYTTGGTIHVVINNQIGYTTLPEDARSTRYSTDIAKMLMVPIFHVHGENPEALVHVAHLAAAYRTQFNKDVVIDLVCYRRYGHNEGDEPYFTQPLMYERIKSRPSAYQLYAQQLLDAGIIDAHTAERQMTAELEKLDDAYRQVHDSSCLFPQPKFFEEMAVFTHPYSLTPVDTQVPADRLTSLAAKLNQVPPEFTPHNKIKMLLRRRMQSIEKNKGIDWANAEALAFASLLVEGLPIRLSGQDCGRGTFSQRHSVLFDRHNAEPYVPLNNLDSKQARYDVFNSLLAEAGVLGFDYGYAMAHPMGLTIWEAQFGDFVNNAQGIIDLFIASGETKWQCRNGLTLLLPHGWEGLGPEHSSARLERFLQLCADDNIQVCNLTTPAQYFHLLRRQAKAQYRKPLVVMTPKSLLRHPKAVSSLTDLSDGSFHPVLDDPSAPHKATKVLICSGKIYYQLLHRCHETECKHIALIRLEQFYPFPEKEIQIALQTYPDAESWVWVQEEPENMGGWQFVRTRLHAVIDQAPAYVGRPAAASPASGFPNIYRQKQSAISDQAVGPIDNGGTGNVGG